MSMLLDALKKSEEQRRLGSQPDIHRPAEEPPDGDSGLVRRGLPLTLIVVAVLVMAWFGWQQFREPAAVSGAPQTAERADPAAQAPAQAAAPAEADAAATPPTPVADFTAPAKAGPSGAGAEPAERQQVAQSISEFKAPPAAPATAAPQDTKTPGPAAAPPRPAPTATAAQGTTAAAPYQPDAMSFWELPQSVRDGLPSLRITVLVYADDPADRFVLIGGSRFRENDEVASGVVLDEIRRDGAVFRARNYRFLVKG
jgi:general secretion pathway protein B